MALDHRRFTAFNNFFLTSQVSFVILAIEFETSGRHSGCYRPREIGVFLCLVKSLEFVIVVTF